MTASVTETITLSGEADTLRLGARLSLWARPGMLVLLEGGLGAGKSTLARAFIRALMKPGMEEDIPSPTFSIVQSYDSTRLPVLHADLYRLSAAAEVEETGIDSALASHVVLVEWPDRLPAMAVADRLHITLTGRGDARTAQLVATGAWATALQRDAAISGFLSAQGHDPAQRSFFEGDASARRYEWIGGSDGVLLMDMPWRPDGPPVRNGKPYSALAHLAEGITAVVAVNTTLVNRGYSAPRVLGCDIKQGLGLIEPLGTRVFGRMMLAGEDMREPLETAAAVLADMALEADGSRAWPREVTVAPGLVHQVPAYNMEAQLIEVDLLPSWYIPHAMNRKATEAELQSFAQVWQQLLPMAVAPHPVWVIRDYHSPNLIWIPERQGLRRVGIIDSQDAVRGHPAYDVASMAQDARVDISPALEQHIINHYCAIRAGQRGFNRADFELAYAVLGAQRASKILGIFARLNKRDGKPGYLRHMPRVADYLRRNLRHPALLPLRQWFAAHIPDLLEVPA